MNFYEDPTPTPFVTVGNTGSYQPQLQQPTKSQGGKAVSHIVDAHVAYIKAIADLSRDKVELLERIKRLEEAGDKIVESGWSVQDWSGMCVVWAKAKEDKL